MTAQPVTSAPTPERVWAVYDEWEAGFAAAFETQAEARAWADEREAFNFTRFPRYTVDQLPTDIAEDECGVHWRVT